MINIIKPEDCCGCTACFSVCNRRAITMKEDAMGFKYPVVNKKLCNNCGLCEKVCQFNENYDQSLQYEKPFAYAVRHKNMKEIESSRSGAAFVALSDWIIENGGFVYGVGFSGHFVATHKKASQKSERDEFKGSKYVQSDLGNIFAQIKKDLQDGYIVMFSGTGCQCAGLNSYVGKKLRQNLYLVDIVCHGVPSPKVWEKYLKSKEKKYGETAKAVSFRDKSEKGWRDHWESITFPSGKIYSKDYTNVFYKHICLRPSCGNCHFCNLHRPSDATLADYWGFERTSADFNADDKGCSLLLINTQKGEDLFNIVKNDINYIEASLPNVMQGHLKEPSKLHPYSKLFASLFPICGNSTDRIVDSIESVVNKFKILITR